MQSTIRLRRSRLQAAVFMFVAMGLALSSCKKEDDPEGDPQDDNIVNYSASFVKSGDNVTTSATGTVTGKYNKTTRELTYSVSWNALTSTVADMHFHDDGPVIIHIEGFPTAVTGSMENKKATFTESQAADLAAGKVYIQIHTANFPGGEVIATLGKGSNPNQNPGPNDPPY